MPNAAAIRNSITVVSRIETTGLRMPFYHGAFLSELLMGIIHGYNE